MRPERIIVIGAGVAGLVAARRLRKAGFTVRVLEAGEAPGGRVGERQARGIRFNAGARLVYAFSKPFNALLQEIGLAGARIAVRGLSAECVGVGESWIVELTPGVRTLLTPGLSPAERLRFLPFGLRMLAARADPDDAASAMAEDGVTLADYVNRELGPNVLERIVEPVFRGARCWNAEEVSAAFFAATAPHLVGRDTVHVLKGGMSQLPQALAAGLDVQCGARVVSVATPADGPCRLVARREGGEMVEEADLVVCATEGSLAAALFPDLPEEERAFFAGVRYNSVGIAHYLLNRQVAPQMKFFTRAASGPIATWQQIPGDEAIGQAPQLYAQLSPEAVAEAKGRGMTERLDELLAKRVRELFPSLDRDCADIHNQWIARMLPIFYPGYARAMTAFRDRQSAAHRRVYFCGDYLAQALITGAVASGERAARDVLRYWSGE
jgi:protoporphyrinogen/coproporphyrinogen III oxidase